MLGKVKKAISKVQVAFYTAMTSLSLMLMAQVPVFAEDATTKTTVPGDGASYNNSIFQTFATLFIGVRKDIMNFSTAAAGVCIGVCVLILMFTKNERASEASWAWLKKIVICYIVLFSLDKVLALIAGVKIF